VGGSPRTCETGGVTPPETPPQLWVLRHGQTAWSAANRHTGRTDVPLTAEGEDQARGLAGRLASVHFDVVLASPLERAFRTAELSGVANIQLEPLAVEWDYGDLEGLTREQIQAKIPGWTAWNHPKMPGGESLDEVAQRARTVIERVRRDAPTRALVVAHAHFLRVLATQWIGEDAGLAEHLLLGAARSGVLGDDRGVPVIDRWNV
jgi:broad specificity phosphatase PhoE